MYSIVSVKGKQYRVEEGTRIFVDRLQEKVGEEVTLDKVLFVKKDDKTFVGKPTVADVQVVAEVTRHFRSPKVIVFKKHRKKGYKKRSGHRQDLTELKINKIVA
ncbi:MAG: 50S ribosomal protein L21 [Elusimicrobia bacterium CG1_02_37_114]|nr:MAG: 50S ribosomal protein L21 [Elusimicrobia bacterium CG1_02_37_114]PIV53832.1 MAG: 50S ribosomal protein L21 [Elusimicrobia bacterium CG02_land_8_20_14_3_00_37_13]PIZ12912.1 MAG: 50S ribosomal protein L21 [Elusimicrobia bacterium CG_4_10_14_0_8_um_filter_37_32]